MPPPPNADLGLAVLIAEYETHYQPLAVISSIAEGGEVARNNDANTRNDPKRYVIWSQGYDGEYRITYSFANPWIAP